MIFKLLIAASTFLALPFLSYSEEVFLKTTPLKTLSNQTEDLSLNKAETIIHFWASWCIPCRVEMKKLFEYQNKIESQNKDQEILMINIKDNQNMVRRLYESLGVKFKTLLDKNGNFSKLNSVSSLPVSLFVNREGRIEKRIDGLIDWED